MSHTTLFALPHHMLHAVWPIEKERKMHTQFWCVLCATKIPDCIEFYIEITTRHCSVCFDDSVHDVPSRLHCYLRARKLSAHFHSLLCGRFWFQFTGFHFSLSFSLVSMPFHLLFFLAIRSIVTLPKQHTNLCSLTFSRLLGPVQFFSSIDAHAITIRCRSIATLHSNFHGIRCMCCFA